MQYEVIEHIKKSRISLMLGIKSFEFSVEYRTSPLTDTQIFDVLLRIIEGIIIRRPTNGELDIYESNTHCRGTWHRLLTTIPTKRQWEKIKELIPDKLDETPLVNGFSYITLSRTDDELIPILKILSRFGELQIPIEKEPDEITKEFHGAVEDCFFCRVPCLWWHMESNTPVCPNCAKTHFVSELPKHRMKTNDTITG